MMSDNTETLVRNIGRPSGSTGEITAPRILRVAMQVFGRRGYEATSMKEIAKAANLTVGSIYHYYPSKADLFIAAAGELYAICQRGFSRFLNQHAAFPERLSVLLQAGKEFFKEEEDLQRFAMGLPTELRHHHELRQALAPQYNQFAELYRRVATEAQNRGELPANTSPTIVAIILEVLFSTAFPQMARAAGEDFEQIVVQLDAVLQKGLCNK